MALTLRILEKSLKNLHGFRPVQITQYRRITIETKQAQAPLPEGHDERNMRLCRPQSPHLTIYRPQLTSMLSITHRITGMILGGYATTFATISLLSDKPMLQIITNVSHCYPNFFLVFKLGLIFPFTYHFFNGIRHLIWDTGHALSMKAVYTSGYIMLLCTISAFSALMYFGEEQKRIQRELKKKADEEAKAKALARAKALEEENSKNKKKKKK